MLSGYYPVQLSTLVLNALLLSTNTISASAANTPSYFQRREDSQICGATNRFQCNLSGLPNNFCCETGTHCLVGAANTTVICCPEGSGCGAIRPIVCDLESQDPNTKNTSVVMTLLLKGTLPACGAGCCPWGYHCGESSNNEAACIRDADQDVFPSGAALPTPIPTSNSPSSTSAAPTSSGSSTASTTAAPLAGGNEGQGSSSNKGLLAGIIVATLAIVAIIMAGIFWCKRSRRTRGDSGNDIRGGSRLTGGAERKRFSSSSFGNFISEPIMNPDTLRSDFGRAKETGSSRVTSANSGVTSSGGARTLVSPGRQQQHQRQHHEASSIDRYWGKEMADAASSPNGPRMEPGPKVGIARVGTAKGRTGAPQIGEIDMGLRATSSDHRAQQRSPDPFQDDAHRYGGDDDEKPVSPKSTSSAAVPPIRGMNKNKPGGSTKYSRPFTPQNNNKGNRAQQQYRPREPSGAEIDVFADPATLADSPGLGRYSVQTTFSDMMEKANLGDVARGAPYVPPPASAQVTPTRPPRR